MSSSTHQNCHRHHYSHTAADVLSIFERVVSISYIIYETILAITTTSQFIINTFGRFFFLQSNIYLKVNQNSKNSIYYNVIFDNWLNQGLLKNTLASVLLSIHHIGIWGEEIHIRNVPFKPRHGRSYINVIRWYIYMLISNPSLVQMLTIRNKRTTSYSEYPEIVFLI